MGNGLHLHVQLKVMHPSMILQNVQVFGGKQTFLTVKDAIWTILVEVHIETFHFLLQCVQSVVQQFVRIVPRALRQCEQKLATFPMFDQVTFYIGHPRGTEAALLVSAIVEDDYVGKVLEIIIY